MRRFFAWGLIGIAIVVSCGGRESGPAVDGGSTGTGGGTTTGTGGGTTGGGKTTGTGGTTVGGTGGTGTGGSGGSGGTGGAIDLSACTGPGQCELAPSKCCACGRLGLDQLSAINSSKRDAFSMQICGAMPNPCPPCVPIIDPPTLMARCESGRCRGFDITSDPTYTKCGSNQDCTLRKGLTCCECGAQGDWVAVSHTGKMLLGSELCGPTSVCPGCIPVPPSNVSAACVNGACTKVTVAPPPAP